ncbi:MAG: carboxylating nicotinate-nucleotide diphosphorylase [Bacteroidetes bacterium]|nr:carboxylating nicotinate-nucleotide diphosphorylase [Bacteroidota bacterium]
MQPMDFRSQEILHLIDLCLREDLGNGDHSSIASIPQGTIGHSRILFKQDGVLAGIELARVILHQLDAGISLTVHKRDGDHIPSGTIVAEAEGSVHSLLAAERLLLNFMQRLSGIATQTAEAMNRLKGYHTQILDTRKTTPGLRLLEKWAVKTGGGANHRIGLYDMIMLKDNHVDSAGGIRPAIERTLAYLQQNNLDLRIEVETRNLAEVDEVLQTGGVHRIMLDNYTPEQCKEAVKRINGRAETEASGGIHLDNLVEYAQSGVDFISLGYLTHSVKALDISMKTHML